MSEENNDGVTVKRSAETSLDEFGAILREMLDDEIETEDGVVTLADYVDRLGRVKDAIEQERRQLRSLVGRFANCHEDNEDFGALLREARFVLTDTPYAVVDGEPVVVLHGRVAEKAGAESRPFVGVDLAKDKPTFVCATIAHGNAAAMRAALEKARSNIASSRTFLAWRSREDELLKEAQGRIDATLAAPARNCDVGTAEDQRRRFDEFCEGRLCAECPFTDAGGDCPIEWANTPAQEGGGHA